MRASVVIATRDNPELVVDAVESILAGTVVPDELIVVDQSDPVAPEVWALARSHPAVRVVASSRVGQTRGRNDGIAASSAEALVLTDDDVLVDSRWLEHMLGALAVLGEGGAVTGRVLAGEPEVAGGVALSLAPDPEPAVFEGRIRRDPLSGNSFALLRSVFEACGEFDERLGPGSKYPSADDNDFGYRLLRDGYRIQYVPEAIVYHRARRAGRALAGTLRDYGRGQGGFIAKHALMGDRWMLSRLWTGSRFWLRRIARRPLRERRLRGHGDVRYLLAFFGGAANWALDEIRRRAQRRYRGDRPRVPRL